MCERLLRQSVCLHSQSPPQKLCVVDESLDSLVLVRTGAAINEGASQPRRPAAQQLNVHSAPAAQQVNVHTAPATQQQNGHTAATVTGLPNQPPALNYHPTNFINVCNARGLTIQCDNISVMHQNLKRKLKHFLAEMGSIN